MSHANDAPAARSRPVSRARSMLVSAILYALAAAAGLTAWGAWKNAQAAAECGSDCGRAAMLMVALGLVLVPASAAWGAMAELVASRMSRRTAHGLAVALALSVFVLIRHPLSSVLA